MTPTPTVTKFFVMSGLFYQWYIYTCTLAILRPVQDVVESYYAVIVASLIIHSRSSSVQRSTFKLYAVGPV